MDKNSQIIRTEIIRILNESGKIRGTELAERVIKKVGNEKIVYREISALVESGEVEKKVHSRSHIEYELINLYESVNNQLKDLHNEINVIYEEIINFEKTSREEKFSFHQRLRSIIHLIHIIQSADGIMKLLSYYPTFKKDKMFSQIKRKIDDCWESIMSNISHQPEDDFLNEVLENLRISQRKSENVN
jgi:DNA-binding HxlR family transcriptional regulator